MAIVIVCVVLIATILIQCFYIGNGTDKYGNRLENIEKYELTEDRLKDIESKLIAEEKVSSANVIRTGRIVYIKITFTVDIELVEAESLALKSLENFTEEEQSYYDFNYTLEQSKTEEKDGFFISGAKNKNGQGLVWNNNRIIEEQEPVGEE